MVNKKYNFYRKLIRLFPEKYESKYKSFIDTMETFRVLIKKCIILSNAIYSYSEKNFMNSRNIHITIIRHRIKRIAFEVLNDTISVINRKLFESY